MVNQNFIPVADIAARTKLPLGYLDDVIHIFSMHNELARDEYRLTEADGLQITPTGLFQILHAFPQDVRGELSGLVMQPIPVAPIAQMSEELEQLRALNAELRASVELFDSAQKRPSQPKRLEPVIQTEKIKAAKQATETSDVKAISKTKNKNAKKPTAKAKEAKNTKAKGFEPIPTPKASVSKAKIAREKHLGETAIMHNGLKATIITWIAQDDITVRFEDGTIKPHMYYCAFQDHSITNVNKKRLSRAELIDALFGKSKTGEFYIAPDGQRYSSPTALCTAYDMSALIVSRNMLQKHWSFDEILQGKPVTEKEPAVIEHGKYKNRKTAIKSKKTAKAKTARGKSLVAGAIKLQDLKIPEVTDEQVKKMYSTDDPILPKLSPEELTWAKKMLGLMKSEKLVHLPLNVIRTKVYDRMRDVYGIVLKQSLRDYENENTIPAKTQISYFRVITQTANLANLFESILTDFATGANPLD